MKYKNTIVPALFLAVISATVVTALSVRAGVVEDIVYRDYSSYLPVFIVFYIFAVIINALYLLKIRQFNIFAAVITAITAVVLWSTPMLIIYKY